MSTYALFMMANAAPAATGAISFWNNTSRLFNHLAAVATGSVLLSQGVGTAPAWGTIDALPIGAVTPSTGVFTTLQANNRLKAAGLLSIDSLGDKTIATGVITLTGTDNPFITVRGEGAAADQLDQVTGVANGDVIYLTKGAEAITIAHAGSGADTFSLPGGSNITMVAGLVYCFVRSASQWYLVGGPYAMTGTGLANVVEDTSPQLGGSLDLNTFTILYNGAIEVLDLTNAGSAVNYLKIQASATGQPIVISALGDDTDVGVTISPKGSGAITLGSTTYPLTVAAQGALIVSSGANAFTTLALGTSGKIPYSNGTTVAYTSFTIGGLTIARGDVLYGSAANTVSNLAIGATGKYLRSDGTDVSWQTIVVGDVSGAAASGSNGDITALTAMTGGIATPTFVTLANGGALRTTTTSGHVLHLSGYNGSAYVPLLTITNAATPTIVFPQDVTITGNLTINGTTTTINTVTLTVNDNIIVLNNDVTGAPTENAGIEIERGTSANVSWLWNETTDMWGADYGDASLQYAVTMNQEALTGAAPTTTPLGAYTGRYMINDSVYPTLLWVQIG